MNISYKLAKQLKDAGFPLGVAVMVKNSAGFEEKFTHRVNDDDVYAPTLPELIEACGDNLDYLRKPFGEPEDNDFDVFWRAFSHRDDMKTTLIVKVQAEGSTPEEAVAKLWLALNKK